MCFRPQAVQLDSPNILTAPSSSTLSLCLLLQSLIKMTGLPGPSLWDFEVQDGGTTPTECMSEGYGVWVRVYWSTN